MNPLMPLVIASALLAVPGTASAFKIWVDVNGPAADLEIDLSGTTLTVTSFTTAALLHNAGANCSGTTIVLTCDFIAPFEVHGSHSADTFEITMDGSSQYVLDVVGRQGQDQFSVLQADEGFLRMAGDAHQDTYTVGASGSPLFIDAGARVEVVPGAAQGTRDIIDLYADVEGHLSAQGTEQGDLVTVEGTVTRADAKGGLLEVDTAGGGDIVDVAVSQVETTYAISSAAERAAFVLKTRGGIDTVNMSGSVDVIGGVYEIDGGALGRDMGGGAGVTFTVDSNGTWISEALFDGGGGSNNKIDPITDVVLGGSTFTITAWP